MVRRLIASAAVLVCFATPRSTFASTIFTVTINTAAAGGETGQLAFDFTTNNPGSSGNEVQIANFSTNGTLGLPQTQGGLVSGDLILGRNPAPSTTIESGSFFNELLLIYGPFGKTTTFTLQLGENPPPSGPPDEFALFLLGANGNSLFSTSDPTGANALFAVDITGASGGALSVFSPTMLAAPNNLEVTVPGVAVVPEPSSLLLLASGLLGLAMYNQRMRSN